jgi:hypothetical protein
MSLHGFGRKLHWRDFKVVPKSRDGQFDAETFVNLSYKIRIKSKLDGTFFVSKVSVTVSFNPLHSWVVKGKQTDDLLKHEQAHYEIAAIGARTIEAKLSALTADTPEDLKSAADDLFHQIAGGTSADGRVTADGVLGDVQKRYDEDAICGSDHSRNTANQAIWQQRITKAFMTKSADISSLDSCPRLSAPRAVDSGVQAE